MIGIGFGFLIQIVSVALMSACGWYSILGLAWDLRPLNAVLVAAFYAILIGTETAAIEEVFFRGFLIRAGEDRFGLTPAVILSSVIFGILHFGGFEAGFPWWASVLSAIACGFVFAEAFLVRQRLWIPLGMHFAWHVAARLLGSTGSGMDEAVFLVTQVDGPELLLSTEAGGAGGFEMLGVVFVSLMLWRMTRQRRKP
jgi:membrane protease YdiL (CAAX protease family)